MGATVIFVAVPADRDALPVRSFATFTQDLHRLADGLASCGIETVAMEATGVYWIPLFQILEARGLKVCLVNARYYQNVPGRRTDVSDCQWLQYLHSVGLLRASFRPPQQVCVLRALRRHRDNPALSRRLEQQVEEVVMESTAQYWKPVGGALERYWQPPCRKREGARPTSGALHLAQAKSNPAPRGRKNDFADAERLVKGLVANELILSLVPDPEQRLWRTLMRSKYQVRCNQVQLHNRLEALLEEAQIKLSSLVSDLLGVSGRRMLQTLADGETDPAVLAALADRRLRATPEQLHDALGACQDLHPLYRRLVKTAVVRGMAENGDAD